MSSATGTILNDDATTLAIAATNAVQNEGNAGSTPFTFTVTRSGDVSAASTVNYAVTGTGANPADGADFTGGVLPSGVVSFAAGQASAVITINVAGDSVVEPNNDFTVTLSGASAGTITTATATGTILNDDTVLPPTAPTQTTSYTGTAGDDVIDLSASTLNNTVDLSQGGNDTFTGGSGNDTIAMGATFTAADRINGGAGNDTVQLAGNYATKFALASTSLTNVETLQFGSGFNYSFILNDGNIAAGGRLTIDATALGTINAATVNGAAELDGTLNFLGGSGNDSFTGGNGNDTFIGGVGADILSGRGGADTFIYRGAADSAFLTSGTAILTTAADTIVSFQPGIDVIDLSAFGFAGTTAASLVVNSTSGFSTTVTPGNTIFGSAGVALEYTSSGTARIFIDANHDGSLNAGDGMIQLFSVANNSIGASSFKF